MGLPLGTDELDTAISPAALVKAGYKFVMLYTRVVTRAQVLGYLNAGLGVVPIFETTADRSLGGAAAGLQDAQTLLRQITALGQPRGTSLAVNLSDFAPPPAQIPAIYAYWKAIISGLGSWQLMGYATGFIIEALWSEGLQTEYWQNAMDDSGWSGSIVAPHAVLYQRTQHTLPSVQGVPASDYDEDVEVAAGLKIWTKTWTPPPPPPAPKPPAPKPVPPPIGLPFPYPLTDYLGVASADPHCHSGLYSPYDNHNVRVWQARMIQRGWNLGPTGADGDYGLKYCQPICKAFQREKGLIDDGKVGPNTWHATWASPVT